MIKFNELFEDNKSTQTETSEKLECSMPWVDKYRPEKIDDMVYQTDVMKMLKNVLKTGNLPHLLFYGPSGVGKTSAILAAARELFGPRKFRERVKELNASDERGINVVRNKIVTLAKMSVSEKDPMYTCPPFKIIILDEADAMTTEAQSALRKTMEDYSHITRFCFICNYINQIISPITSRCVKFRFKPINDEFMTERLLFIAQNEKMDIGKSAIKKISEISNGDMRKGIMILQNLNYYNKKIVVDDVLEISNMIPIEEINQIIDVCVTKKNVKISKIKNKTNDLISSGYPVNIILSQLINQVILSEKLTDNMKAIICYHISKTEKRLIDGADEYLQLLSALMCIRSSFLGIALTYEKK
ncbi:replication factor C small subunit [Indivirus ILV1]|uniref:Replication factor C small subunit n=1 Tax=Indivirus ILV1 TaxID=1977633 RepID=A0A1V0SD56_9VIRU|nr:replication factor C small subunit [Indivirus ILV1]